MTKRLRAFGSTDPSAIILLAFLAVGAICGHFIGQRLHNVSQQNELEDYGQTLLRHAIKLFSLARTSLDDINNSPFTMCSPAERKYLRGLLFASDHIKDIVRLKEGRMQCSLLQGEGTLDYPMPEPLVQLDDGTDIYGEIPLANPAFYGPVIGRGEASVVVNPAAFDPLHRESFSFSVFIGPHLDAHYARLYQYPVGRAPNLPSLSSLDKGQASGDNLQSVSCSKEGDVCVVVAAKLNSSSVAAQLKRSIAILLGLLGGSLLGVGWMRYRNRDRSLSAQLLRAINRKELTLVYQPIVDITNGRIVSFETLVRWELSKGDFVPPDVFIAKAEEKGICGEVTRYVVDCMLQEMTTCLRSQPDLCITINITAGDLEDETLSEFLAQRLQESGIAPTRIGLEVTERVAIESSEALAGLARLRSAGHILYIDDFGTGYSSLAYLGQLHVDVLKMDRAFTQTVGTDAVTVSIVPQIIAMAQQHNLGIVVEGVETQAQADYFKNLPFKVLAQGYYFGAPMGVQKARKLLAQNAAAKHVS